MLGPPIGLMLGVLFTECLGRKGTILVALAIASMGALVTVLLEGVGLRSVGLLLWGLGSETAFSIVFNIVT